MGQQQGDRNTQKLKAWHRTMWKGKTIGKNVLEYGKNSGYRKRMSDVTTDSNMGSTVMLRCMTR